MAGSGGYSVTIGVVDRATKGIDAINKRLENVHKRVAAARAPFDRFSQSLSKLSKLSGMDRVGRVMRDVGRGMGQLGRNAGDAFQKIGQIVAPLGVITGAASVAGMARMVGQWADWGSKLGFAAQRIGLSSGQLNAFQGAARLAGASSGAMTSGLQNLGQTMYDAIGGRAPEAVAMFNTLGIAFQDSTGHARSVAEVMPEVADRIAAIKDPYTQARIATALFQGAGEDLLPVLRLGSSGIRELTETARRYGGITAAGEKAANAFRVAQEKVTMAAQGLGGEIAARLAPALVPMLTDLANFIAAHRDDIAGFFGDVATRIKDWYDGDGFKTLLTGVQEFAKQVSETVDKLGGWKEVSETIFEIWAGAKFLGMLAKIKALAGVLISMHPVLRAILAVSSLAGDSGPNVPKKSEAEQKAIREQAIADGAMTPGQAWGANMPTWLGGDKLSQFKPGTNAAATLGMQHLMGLGWSKSAAAGAIANVETESQGFNTQAVGDGGTAFGLMQWHKDRQQHIEDHFHRSLKAMDFYQQLDALDWETRTYTPDSFARMQNAAPGVAGSIFSREVERPKRVGYEASMRGQLAEERYRMFDPSGPAMQIGDGSGRAGTDGTMQVNTHVTIDAPPGMNASARVSSKGSGVSAPPPKVARTGLAASIAGY